MVTMVWFCEETRSGVVRFFLNLFDLAAIFSTSFHILNASFTSRLADDALARHCSCPSAEQML
jgi:hypothetical protein